jgi:ferritin-like metal-binding protein YciE
MRAFRKDQAMPADNLHELFVDELKDIYDAEKQLTKALPKMAKGADSPDLRAAFEEHFEITRMQVNRLEEVFKSLGIAARGKPCEGMKGLIKEGQEMMEELDRGATLDAALIAAAQKVEHYEIASYGTLATFAEIMGHQDAKDLLGQTLDEEKEADDKLTQVAGQINFDAEAEGEEDEESSMAAVGSRKKSSRGKKR